jgi:hypothetical protein
MSSAVDVFGPLFLSYRHNDGSEIVDELAWLLRAAGIPVWRDKDDLPPGDTADKLRQAIGEGLSGAALVITEDVANSHIVRKIEAPQLIALQRDNPQFQLLIANDVATDKGSPDYAAPDRLLRRFDDDLAGVDQSASSTAGLLKLTRKALSHRMVQHRLMVEANGVFELTIQTRNVGQVFDRTGAQLDIRVRRSAHEKLPDPQGLEDLRHTLAMLADAITTTGARDVRVRGGAHLSVAFALGVALPSSRIGQLEVVDQRSVVWISGPEAAVPSAPKLLFDVSENSTAPLPGERPRVAIYVDLLPTRSDPAFERYLDEFGEGLAAYAILTAPVRGLLDSSTAGAIASEAMGHIRQLSATYANAHVDLLLAVPFGIAVLMGHLGNTLRMRLFEWDDSDETTAAGGDARPRYVPSLAVRAGGITGPISSVALPICTG